MTGQSIQVESTGLAHIVTQDYANIYHRTFDGVSLSAPEAIPGASNVNSVGSSIDGNDELHVVWKEGWSPTIIKHTKTVGGIFDGTVTDLYVEPGEYRNEMMNIQHNPDGHIMVTWLNNDVDKTDVYFMYTLNEGAGFSPAVKTPHQIHIRRSTDPSPSYTNLAPNLVATPNGYFHLIYYSNEADLVINIITFDQVYNGTEWETPRIAFDYPSTGQTLFDISVCAGSDGDIHVTGIQEGSYYLRYVRYDAETDTWQDAIDVVTNNAHYCYGAVDVDNASMVHLVYAHNADGYLHMKVFCSHCDESEILATPDTLVDDTTINNEHNHTDLMWDNDGNLLAVYQDTRNSPIYTYFNRLTY